jgi:serine/threonine protein kinase
MAPTVDSFYILGCGGDRCAIQIKDIHGDSVVLKASRFHIKQTRAHREWSRKDGLIMEELTSSPYVVDIWGSCALSHFEELGGSGDLHARIKLAREYKQEMSPLDKLRICVQVSTAVADMHDLGVAHNDICCNQIILIDGIYKLNDFNLATFQRRNKNTKRACLDAQITWNDRVGLFRNGSRVCCRSTRTLTLHSFSLF